MEYDFKTVDYRLTNIEKTLTELKNVVLETKLQEKDIKRLEETQGTLLNAINAHDKRIRSLELKPEKDKAEKWQIITDYIFKAIVIAIAGLVATKLGLKI